MRCFHALLQPDIAVLIHQEADRSTVHPVDHLALVHIILQRLQHKAVATQRNNYIGVPGSGLAVNPGQIMYRLVGVRRAGGKKSKRFDFPVHSCLHAQMTEDVSPSTPRPIWQNARRSKKM
jgi:hypothetical protein